MINSIYDVPPWEIKRQVVYRVEDVRTNPNYGFNPYKRPLSMHLSLGVINLDKPTGPTSHQVTDTVKKLIGIDQAGHGGTLEY